MKTVLSVHLSEMCELVQSTLTLRYKDGNDLSLLEEIETIENLCRKFGLIPVVNEGFSDRHLLGRKFKSKIKDGKTYFMGYCSDAI